MKEKIRNKEIGQFLKKGTIFIVAFIVLDLVLGTAASKLVSYQETGKNHRIRYAIEKDQSELLVLGSSHAMRHFIPEIFEEELHLSTYNSGAQGQSLVFLYALAKMRMSHHTPKAVIINLDEKMFSKSKANFSRLADLHPYYWEHRDLLHPLLSIEDPYIDFKMLFQSYRNNSSIGHVLKFFVKPEYDDRGYSPLKGSMKSEQLKRLKEKFVERRSTQSEIDPIVLDLFNDLLQSFELNNVEVIMVVSPCIDMNGLDTDSSILEAKKIAEEKNIPLFDYQRDERFQLKYERFKDFGHLNHEGSIVLSNIVVQDFKPLNE